MNFEKFIVFPFQKPRGDNRKGRNVRGELTVEAPSKNYSDNDLQQMLRYIQDKLQQCSAESVQFNLSENRISNDGVKNLMSWLRSSVQLKLRILKLYKNNITDEGAIAIADYIRSQGRPDKASSSRTVLEELHLSHNRITSKGVEAVLNGICDAGHQGNYTYPRYDFQHGVYLPIWVRLEQNLVEDPLKWLECWQVKAADRLRSNHNACEVVCLAARTSSHGGHCSPKNCLHCSSKGSPLVHLFTFDHQSSSTRHGFSGDRVRDQLCPIVHSSQSTRIGWRVRSDPEPCDVKVGVVKRSGGKTEPATHAQVHQPNGNVMNGSLGSRGTDHPKSRRLAVRKGRIDADPSQSPSSSAQSSASAIEAMMDHRGARQSLPPLHHRLKDQGLVNEFQGLAVGHSDDRDSLVGERRDLQTSDSHEHYNSDDSQSSTNVPLYLVLDDSAFWEMRELRKADIINPWSFPGLVGMWNLEIIQRSDAEAEFLILMPDMVVRECEETVSRQPVLAKAYDDCQEGFINQLVQCELVQVICNGTDPEQFMALDSEDVNMAKSMRINTNTILAVDFALLWMANSPKQVSDECHRHLGTVFLTANPSVMEWIEWLNSKAPTTHRKRLEYVSPREMNIRLRAACPHLLGDITQPGVLTSPCIAKPSRQPYAVTCRMVSDFVRQARSPMQTKALVVGSSPTNNADSSSVGHLAAFQQSVHPDASNQQTGLPQRCEQFCSSLPSIRVNSVTNTQLRNSIKPIQAEDLEKEFIKRADFHQSSSYHRATDQNPFVSITPTKTAWMDSSLASQSADTESAPYFISHNDQQRKDFFEALVLLREICDWFRAIASVEAWFAESPDASLINSQLLRCDAHIARWVTMFASTPPRTEFYYVFTLLKELHESLRTYVSVTNVKEIFAEHLLNRSLQWIKRCTEFGFVV